MPTILRKILEKTEKVDGAISSYIDDIIVNETELMAPSTFSIFFNIFLKIVDMIFGAKFNSNPNLVRQ